MQCAICKREITDDVEEYEVMFDEEQGHVVIDEDCLNQLAKDGKLEECAGCGEWFDPELLEPIEAIESWTKKQLLFCLNCKEEL